MLLIKNWALESDAEASAGPTAELYNLPQLFRRKVNQAFIYSSAVSQAGPAALSMAWGQEELVSPLNSFSQGTTSHSKFPTPVLFCF